MSEFWSLEIKCDDSLKDSITVILGIKPNTKHVSWGLEKIIKDNDPYVDYVEYFLDLLEGNYEKLASIGVERNDINAWSLYEYDQQCNLAFLPHNLKRLGENGIVLCVSCWQKQMVPFTFVVITLIISPIPARRCCVSDQQPRW